MQYDANAGTAVVLRPKIVGADGVAVTAEFRLFNIGATPSTEIMQAADGSFTVPSGLPTTMTPLRLETQATFNGPTSANVYVPATQGGAAIHNEDPVPPGQSNDWLEKIPSAMNGVIVAKYLYIAFD
jgi:hypothetical protein